MKQADVAIVLARFSNIRTRIYITLLLPLNRMIPRLNGSHRGDTEALQKQERKTTKRARFI